MAYNAATVIQLDPPGPDQRIHAVVRFSSPTPGTEPNVNVDYYVDGGQAPAAANLQLRTWAIAQIARLNDRKTTVDAITLPFTINLTPPTPPGATAEEIWLEKKGRLVRFLAMGPLTGTPATDRDALLADVIATYLIAYRLKV